MSRIIQVIYCGRQNRMFQCGECDQKFPTPALLTNHMKMHVHVELAQCFSCFKYFLNNSQTSNSSESATHFLCMGCSDNKGYCGQSIPSKEEVPAVEVQIEIKTTHQDVDHVQDRADSSVLDCDQDLSHCSNKAPAPSCAVNAKTFLKFVSDIKKNGETGNHSNEVKEDELYETEVEKKIIRRQKKKSKDITTSASLDLSVEESSKQNPQEEPEGLDFYLCVVCEMKFNKYNSLKEHLQTHETRPTKPYACGLCEYSCKLATDLKRHLHRHTGKKGFECQLCGKMFAVSQSLSRHMKMHNGIKPHECPDCKKAFTELSKLRIHQRIHSGEKPYPCRFCEKSFSNNTSRKVHERTHTGEKPYHCNRCDAAFNTSGALREHENIHLNVKPYVCKVCGKGFSQYRPFTNHQRIHTGEKPYKCTKCGRSFRSNQTYSYHINNHDKLKNNHKELDPVELKVILENEEKKNCKFCWRSFEDPQDLARHFSQLHTGERQYVCEVCGARFGQDTSFKLHIAKRHLQCSACGQIFSDRAELKAHRKQHVVMCRVCDKTFPRSCHLASHYRSHTQEKPFQCDECGKMFGGKQSLEVHRKNHTDLLPVFMCDVCGKTLKSLTNLKSHMKIHLKV